jgi:hypothetical protein
MSTWRAPTGDRKRREMGVVAFIALTVAVFVLLGIAQRLVERL